jgi:hypothetical protein
MSPSPGSELADSAIFDGGPLDGKEQPVERDTERLCAVMTDGQQHQYLRAERTQVLPDGRAALVFGYGGQYYGPN